MFSKKRYIEFRNEKIGNHSITFGSGIEKGIFFRHFLRRETFSTYDYETSCPQQYYEKCKSNLVKRLIEYLKGNYTIINRVIPRSMEERDYDWGVYVNCFISPVYFKREFRELICEAGDYNASVQKIVSYGYNDIDEEVGGNCRFEKTSITLKNGKKIKSVADESYHYTYFHIIRDNVLNEITT